MYNSKGDDFDKNKVCFDPKYIDLETMFKYNSKNGKIRPSIGFGLLTGYLLNFKDAFTKINWEGKRIDFSKYDKDLELGYVAEIAFNFYFNGKNKLALIFDYQNSETLFKGESTYNNGVIGMKLGYKF